MTAKGISSGIEHQATDKKNLAQKQIDQMSKQWRDFRNRLDTILLTSNVMKTTEIRQKTLALDEMNFQERQDYIRIQWGPLYLQKCEPLLSQLDLLERHIIAARQARNA